jgi:hypothetical protein
MGAKEREVEQKAQKILMLNPTIYGIGIDLRALLGKDLRHGPIARRGLSICSFLQTATLGDLK